MKRTIWDLKSRESCIITKYNDTLSIDYQTRLKDLGFHKGERVECVSSPGFGAPKLFKINNAIFALDHVVARGVHCE